MKKTAMQKRNATIAAMAAQGVTATRLAVDNDLSEARIYQIIRSAGATGNGEGTIRSEYFWKKRNKYIAKGLDRNKAYHKAALKTLEWCLKDESRMVDTL